MMIDKKNHFLLEIPDTLVQTPIYFVSPNYHRVVRADRCYDRRSPHYLYFLEEGGSGKMSTTGEERKTREVCFNRNLLFRYITNVTCEKRAASRVFLANRDEASITYTRIHSLFNLIVLLLNSVFSRLLANLYV